MQAFKTEKTDLDRPAYYCFACCNAFLGKPQEKPCEGVFNDDGEWVDMANQFTIAFTCHDDPPCEPVPDLESGHFYIGTLGSVYRMYSASTVIDPATGQRETIVPNDIWSCGNCEHTWDAGDYGQARARDRAV